MFKEVVAVLFLLGSVTGMPLDHDNNSSHYDDDYDLEHQYRLTNDSLILQNMNTIQQLLTKFTNDTPTLARYYEEQKEQNQLVMENLNKSTIEFEEQLKQNNNLHLATLLLLKDALANVTIETQGQNILAANNWSVLNSILDKITTSLLTDNKLLRYYIIFSTLIIMCLTCVKVKVRRMI